MKSVAFYVVLLVQIFFIIYGSGCAGKKSSPITDGKIHERGSTVDSVKTKAPEINIYDRIAKKDTVWVFKDHNGDVDTVKFLLSGTAIKVVDDGLENPSLSVLENDSIIGYVWKFGTLGVSRGKMFASKTVNVRSGRGTKYRKIGQFLKGEEVEVDSLASDWYRLPSYKGKIGYVHSDYLKTTEEYEFDRKGVLDLFFTFLFAGNFKPTQVFTRYFWEWKETSRGKRISLVLIVDPNLWRLKPIWYRNALVDAVWEGFYVNLKNGDYFDPIRDPSPKLFIVYDSPFHPIYSLSDICPPSEDTESAPGLGQRPRLFMICERTLDYYMYSPSSDLFEK